MKKVLVVWVDTGVIHGWLETESNNDCIAYCKSLGFLIKENDEGVTICFGISDQGLVMEKKTIPRGCIKAIKELRIR